MGEYIKRTPRYDKAGKVLRHDLYLVKYVGKGKKRKQEVVKRLGAEERGQRAHAPGEERDHSQLGSEERVNHEFTHLEERVINDMIQPEERVTQEGEERVEERVTSQPEERGGNDSTRESLVEINNKGATPPKPSSSQVGLYLPPNERLILVKLLDASNGLRFEELGAQVNPIGISNPMLAQYLHALGQKGLVLFINRTYYAMREEL